MFFASSLNLVLAISGGEVSAQQTERGGLGCGVSGQHPLSVTGFARDTSPPISLGARIKCDSLVNERRAILRPRLRRGENGYSVSGVGE